MSSLRKDVTSLAQVGEKERESRRMHGEAVRVENHAEKLRRDRAKTVENISSKEHVCTRHPLMIFTSYRETDSHRYVHLCH